MLRSLCHSSFVLAVRRQQKQQQQQRLPLLSLLLSLLLVSFLLVDRTRAFSVGPHRRGRVAVPSSSSSFQPSSRRAVPRSNNSMNRHPRSTTTARHMFTGIIEEMGTVVSLTSRPDLPLWDGTLGEGTELVIHSNDGIVLQDAYLGCSICVSGVCLTVTEYSDADATFTVGLAPETLRRSHLGHLSQGDVVNLERASEIGGRNSGHFVQGHVDGMGTIIEQWKEVDSLFFKVQVNEDEIIKYIVPKGFIAIDGTSLTVVAVNYEERWFTFMLVAYTQKKIVLPLKKVGDKVNLEVDVLGKYSENALAAFVPRLEALEAKVESLERQLAVETVVNEK